MQTCSRCCKWRLLAGECTVCASLERLKAAASSSRLPSTSEAEAKTTKILDGAYYSLARLFPESDEEAGKGEPSPKKKTAEETPKGEKSPTSAEKAAQYLLTRLGSSQSCFSSRGIPGNSTLSNQC